MSVDAFMGVSTVVGDERGCEGDEELEMSVGRGTKVSGGFRKQAAAAHARFLSVVTTAASAYES